MPDDRQHGASARRGAQHAVERRLLLGADQRTELRQGRSERGGRHISGTVTAISYDEKTVTASANASASGQITATGTFTGYNICSLNRPSFQGRIT